MPAPRTERLSGQTVTTVTVCPHRRGTRAKGTYMCRLCNPPAPPLWATPSPFYRLVPFEGATT